MWLVWRSHRLRGAVASKCCCCSVFACPRALTLNSSVCVPSQGHVAVWRIKLAAVPPPLGPSALLGPIDSSFALKLCPTHFTLPSAWQIPFPNPMSHTRFWLVAISTSSPCYHDTIYSMQPLLPRVLWLPSMQISHVLIVVIFLFFIFLWNRGEAFPSELIRWLSRKRKEYRLVAWDVIQHA